MTKTCFAFVRIQATRSSKSAQDASFLKRAVKKKEKKRKKSTALSANYPPSSILRVMETIGAFYIIMKLRKLSQFLYFFFLFYNCQHEYLSISPGSVFQSVGRSVGRAGARNPFIIFFKAECCRWQDEMKYKRGSAFNEEAGNSELLIIW